MYMGVFYGSMQGANTEVEAQNGTIEVTPETDVEALVEAINGELADGWNVDPDIVESIRHNALANDSVVIVEGWFSDKELSGINFFTADKAAETDAAIQFERLADLRTIDDTAHFQRNMSGSWVPKSVIQVEIVSGL